MENAHNTQLGRRQFMQFVKLSDTQGINLSHIIEWTDTTTGTEPMLVLLTTAGTVSMDGLPEPRTIRLLGEDRVKMLHWLDQVGMYDDWKAAYDECRAEYVNVCATLTAYREWVDHETQLKIEEYARH